MEFFLIGVQAEDSATELKRDQLNVCTVAEICARLAGNSLSVVDNSKVWGI
jgi:hypothetical protein